jgi:hypothetical protein
MSLRKLIKHITAIEMHDYLYHSAISRQKYTIIVAFFLHFCAVEMLKKHLLKKYSSLTGHQRLNLIV